MARPKSKKHRYNFLIDRGVYNKFSEICEEKGLVRSKRLELYMKKFIDDHKELLRSLKKREDAVEEEEE